jgi:glycosyltransferase involved in cell wall biosynthesis
MNSSSNTTGAAWAMGAVIHQLSQTELTRGKRLSAPRRPFDHAHGLGDDAQHHLVGPAADRAEATVAVPGVLALVVILIASTATVAPISVVAPLRVSKVTGQMKSIPSAWWVNDILSSDFFGWPVRRAVVSRARRLQPRLAAVSQFGQQALIREGVPANAVRTVHNGIPLARYRHDPRRPLRAQLGLPDSEPLFGIVGRLTPWKGQDIFLRVAAQWAKSGRPGQFAIIGGAFNEDAPFETHLREFVQHHGLTQRVHFVPFQPDIASAISSSTS